jgi:hypothetical protein
MAKPSLHRIYQDLTDTRIFKRGFSDPPQVTSVEDMVLAAHQSSLCWPNRWRRVIWKIDTFTREKGFTRYETIYFAYPILPSVCGRVFDDYSEDPVEFENITALDNWTRLVNRLEA